MILGLCLFFTALSAADDDWPAEGFSADRSGLPDQASEAWQSTVLVAKNEALVGRNPRIRFGTPWGSGLVLQTGPDASQPTGRMAYVVTNAHVVRCEAPPCRYAVGFNSNGSHWLRNWARAVEIVAEIPEKDLAFLKVAVPGGSKLPTPILGGSDVEDNGFEPVVTPGRDCVHLVIASGEILSEFNRIMGGRTLLARGH